MRMGIASVVTAFAILASAQLGGAQPAGKAPRIAYLSTRPASMEKVLFPAFLKGLRELGYTEGKDILIERRNAAPHQREKIRELVREMVRLKVDAIVASGGPLPAVAKKTTSEIPIVFVPAADPVGEGLVESLARPGGNVTGLSDFHGDLVGKRLELLREVAPSASRVAFLWDSADPAGPLQLKDLQGVAPRLGVTLLSFGVKGPQDFEPAFAAMGRERPGALIVHGNPLLASQQGKIFQFAAGSRLPAIYTHGGWTNAGGLMSYGADFPDLWRRAAWYVVQILKGAKPGDLPVEQPTKFELVINLKTAKALGLTIPPEVLQRADRVIK